MNDSDFSKFEENGLSLSEVKDRLYSANNIIQSLEKKLKDVDEACKKQHSIKSKILKLISPQKSKEFYLNIAESKVALENLIIAINKKKKVLLDMEASFFSVEINSEGKQVREPLVVISQAINQQLRDVATSIHLLDSKIAETNNELLLIDVKALPSKTFKENFIKFFSEVEFTESHKFDKKYKEDLEKMLARFSLTKQNLLEKKAYLTSCKIKIQETIALKA